MSSLNVTVLPHLNPSKGKNLQPRDFSHFIISNSGSAEKTCTSVLKGPKPSATDSIDSTTNYRFVELPEPRSEAKKPLTCI